ncbi:FHA domain-containing protein [Arthrobacter sp. zg-Y238]|nr:FHA domain-containing protein [Arthrobacter sp. zg-Y238]
MVQVPSSGGDISRSHAEIRLEGWHVMLRDLFSTNGTVLVRNGQLPHRLGQGEGVIVLDGDTAELGDDVWIRFEGLA